jgi:hypothetical protein
MRGYESHASPEDRPNPRGMEGGRGRLYVRALETANAPYPGRFVRLRALQAASEGVNEHRHEDERRDDDVRGEIHGYLPANGACSPLCEK